MIDLIELLAYPIAAFLFGYGMTVAWAFGG